MVAEEHAERSQVLDVTAQQIARVYAQAFLDAIATQNGKVEEDVQQLDSVVADVLDRFPRFETTLLSALVSTDEKMKMLDNVFGGSASRNVLSLLKVLASHGRLDLLRAVRMQVEQLHNERLGRREIEVRVARELSDDIRRDLVQRIQARLGVEPLLNVKVDPSLIAGIVVSVGDTVYDGSTANQLRKARKSIIEQTVEMIQTARERLTADP